MCRLSLSFACMGISIYHQAINKRRSDPSPGLNRSRLYILLNDLGLRDIHVFASLLHLSRRCHGSLSHHITPPSSPSLPLLPPALHFPPTAFFRWPPSQLVPGQSRQVYDVWRHHRSQMQQLCEYILALFVKRFLSLALVALWL